MIELGRRKKSKPKPKGYLVWGAKPKGGVNQKGRQLGRSQTTKTKANRLQRQFKNNGYVCTVQPTFRTPKK